MESNENRENMVSRITEIQIDVDPFDFPDEELLQRYTLNKAALEELFQMIEPYIQGTGRLFSKHRKVAGALNYYRAGLPHKTYRDTTKVHITPSVQEVTRIIDEQIADKFIKFPASPQEQDDTQQRFLLATGLPGILGAMACFHVKIKKPKENEEVYKNIMQYYSKHVQIICDYDMNILACYARIGGSVPNTEIWKHSSVKTYMEVLHAANITKFKIVTDSTYPQENWLMTPYDQPDGVYHDSQLKAHLPVRRLIAILREVFGCFSHTRGILVYPGYAGAIINCCCALHNLRQRYNLPMPQIDHDKLVENDPVTIFI